MIEHEVEVMARYADRVIVMDHGRIVMNGTPADVLSRVDELAQLGLRAPDAAAVIHGVNERLGTSLTVPVTLDAAVAEVESLVGAR
jgi:ABC-type glutathione transport system ATPase component